MSRFASSVYLPASPAEVWAWHARPGALARLAAPWDGTRVLQTAVGLEDGAQARLSVPIGPLRIRWTAEHTDCRPGLRFTDRQLRGPFTSWEHVHHFDAEDDGCRLLDVVDYRLPCGRLGHALADEMVRRRLERLFTWRHQRTLGDLGRHRDFRSLPPLKVAIAGATGLVGSDLSAFLTSGGHTVLPLVRPASGVRAGIRWDPERGEIDAEALTSCDAVVHLGGQPVAGRWTAKRRRAILDSRLTTTRLLAETLARSPRPPGVLIVASAVGWYGDRGEDMADESSPPGQGFLAEVCEAWENACEPAVHAGIRVVNLRIGMVVSGKGGALPRLLAPFRLGLGGPLGSGSQWVSWIAIDDLVYLIHHALRSRSMVGPVNAVAPAPVRNRELAACLGRILNRRSSLRVPERVVSGMLGDMGREMLLSSCRVISRQLEQQTFAFSSPALEQALRWELGRPLPSAAPVGHLSDSSWSS